jgi:hypothetical protein
MRWALFWVFVALFAITTIGTLLAVFFGIGSPSPQERSILVNVFVVEIGAAVAALFYSLFRLKGHRDEAEKEPAENHVGLIGSHRHPGHFVEKSLLEDEEKQALRRIIADILATTYQIYHQSGRQQPALEVLSQQRIFTIQSDGNCSCVELFEFRVLQGSRAMELFSISGEPDVSMKDLSFSVEARKGRQAVYLPAYDGPREKRFVVFILPSVEIDEEEELAVAWRWPRLFQHLYEGMPDRWEERSNPHHHIKRMRITFRLHGLGRVILRNLGEAGGHCGSTQDERTGISECSWEATEVAPGSRVVLQLDRGGKA